jgi:hypothetical protein
MTLMWFAILDYQLNNGMAAGEVHRAITPREFLDLNLIPMHPKLVDRNSIIEH